MRSKDPIQDLAPAAFPAEEARAELLDRVMRLNPQPHRPSPWLAIGSTCAAAAAVGVVVVMTATPSRALAEVILGQVSNMHGHFKTWVVDATGQRTLASEQWVDGNKQRIIRYGPGAGVRIVDPANNIDVDWSSPGHKLSFRDGDIATRSRGMGASMLTVNSLEGVIKEYRKLFKTVQEPKVRPSTFNGKAADLVDLTIRGGHTLIYADPETHRVVGYEMHIAVQREDPNSRSRNGSGQRAMRTVRIESISTMDSVPADPSVFEPIFDIDGHKVDAYKERDRFKEQLSHAIASYRVPEAVLPYSMDPQTHRYSNARKTIVPACNIGIRDVSRNRDGDLFVIYTGVNGPYGTNVIPATLSDSYGGVYTKGIGFRPYEVGGDSWPGYTFQGKPLEGAWFIHVSGRTPTGPISIGFKKEFEPMTHLAFVHKQVPEETEGEVPNYMPFMGMGVNSVNLEESKAGTIADYLTRQAPNYPLAEKYWRRFIALSEKRTERFFSPQSWPYYYLGFCVEHQGRYAEALKLLKVADSRAEGDPANMKNMIEHEIRLVQHHL